MRNFGSRARSTSFAFLIGSTVLLASSSWHNKDAGQWTDDDVQQILTNSPWSKEVKMTFLGSRNSGGYEGGDQNPSSGGGSQGGGGGTWGDGGQMPGGIGGTSRGGMGGGGMGGQGGGMGRGRENRSMAPPVEVTVQWESALPVRMALAKKSEGNASASSLKPMDEYVIAISGFPTRTAARRRQSTSTGPDDNIGDDSTANLQDRLKQSTSLLRKSHDPLRPEKVELVQSNSENQTVVLHFAKTDPITLNDKDVELRISTGSMELDKKFNLKSMEYQDKLEL